MGCSRIHGMGPLLAARLIIGMKIFHRNPKFTRRRANFIQRQQSVVDIHDRIFNPFCHQGASILLEAHNEMQPLIFIFLAEVVIKFE